MKTYFVIKVSPPIPSTPRFHHQSHQLNIWQNSDLCNISRKKWMMKCVFGMQINIKVLYKFILSFWVCVARHAQSAQNKKFAYLCNISRIMWGWSLFFVCRQTQKFFYKLVVSLLVCVDRHTQSTQNNMFVISLQCHFCLQLTWKFPTSWFQQFGHQRFPQGDTIITDWRDLHFWVCFWVFIKSRVAANIWGYAWSR